jgi:hypothetical protein
METHSPALDQLTSDRVDEFLVERRATYRSLYSRRALRPLLGVLAGLELLPVEEPVPVKTSWPPSSNDIC